MNKIMEKILYKVGFECGLTCLEYRYFACNSLTELDSYTNRLLVKSIEVIGDVYIIEKVKEEKE